MQSTNALEAREPQQWLAAQGHSEAELEVLRRFICVDFKGQSPTDGELMFFMLYCKQHGLDPFARQAHLLKTKNGPQVCLGIDGMRIRAAQSGEYGGQDEPAFELDPKGAVLACRVVVYRIVQGQRVPFPAVAWMAESRGTSPIWSQRPRGMLEKCAEAKALRKAFPDRCGAFYAPEELDGQDSHAPRKAATATAADLNARLAAKKAPEPVAVEAEFEDVAPYVESPASVQAVVHSHQGLLGAFQKIGVGEKDILGYLEKQALDDINEKDVASLRSWYRELTDEARQ